MPTSIELMRRGKLIQAELEAADEKVARGDRVDLSALEGRIRGFCTAVSTLPADQAKTFTRSLEEVILRLDRLEKSVNTQLLSSYRRLAQIENELAE